MDEKRGVSSEPASISPVCFFLDDFSIFHVFFSLLLFQFAYGFLFFFLIVSGGVPAVGREA